MEVWRDKLGKLYKNKRATVKTLTAAVKKGWITEEEKKEIIESGQ